MKKSVVMVCLLFAMLLFPAMTVQAAGASFKNNNNGTVTVKYNNSAKKTIKVQVVKSGSSRKYTYSFPSKNTSQTFACTEGAGSYSIVIYQQTSSGKYATVDSSTVSISSAAASKVFLTSNQTISWSSTNAAIKKAKSLTKSCKSSDERIKKVYKYLVENYSYDYNKMKQINSGQITTYTPNISSVYKSKKGICYDMAALNAAMLRSLGIKTKLIKGYSTNSGLQGVYHAWNKISSGSSWYVVDTTYDMQKYKKVNYSAMKKKSSLYSTENYQY